MKKLNNFQLLICLFLSSCNPKILIKYTSSNFGDGGYWLNKAIVRNKRFTFVVYHNFPNEIDNFEAFNIKMKKNDVNYISQIQVKKFKNLPNKIGIPGGVDEGIETIEIKQKKNKYSIEISHDTETKINQVDSLFNIFRKYKNAFFNDYKKRFE